MKKKLVSDEVIGFAFGVVLVGCVAYWLMPEKSVWEVVKVVVSIYRVDFLVSVVVNGHNSGLIGGKK